MERKQTLSGRREGAALRRTRVEGGWGEEGGALERTPSEPTQRNQTPAVHGGAQGGSPRQGWAAWKGEQELGVAACAAAEMTRPGADAKHPAAVRGPEHDAALPGPG